MTSGDKSMEHGRSAYVLVRCRCEICVAAQRAYQKAYREQRTARYAEAQRHITEKEQA